MYPGSVVALDCIDSYSLHPYLLCKDVSELMTQNTYVTVSFSVFLKLLHLCRDIKELMTCATLPSLKIYHKIVETERQRKCQKSPLQKVYVIKNHPLQKYILSVKNVVLKIFRCMYISTKQVNAVKCNSKI